MSTKISRRTLFGAAAVGAAVAVLSPEIVANAADVLPAFPPGISLYRERYASWDGTIVSAPLWSCVPNSQNDVVSIVNWAADNGYTVRPRGYMHSWSPLTVESDTQSSAKVLLVDMTKNLTAMSIPAPNRVTVEAGARMDTLLRYLHDNGAAVASAPAPGDVTVGGVLAVNGHGTAILAAGESRATGQSMGTVSNLVTSLTAIVWDPTTQRYAAKTFGREHPDAKAFLTGIGRTFLLEVTLQTMADHNIRCRNYTDISIDRLFSAPDQADPRSLTKLLDEHGRVGLIWYTYTKYPWVQTWSVTPKYPRFSGSRPTYKPYNYPFADRLPDSVASLIGRITAGHARLAPSFGAKVLAATVAGLTATGARDMWGPVKDFINFVQPTTLRVSAGSHAVVTRRADVQRVVHEFSTWFTAAQERYRSIGQYPVNSCVEIRVTGVDTPHEVDVVGAEAPSLSAARPVDEHPEYDTVVWLDTLTIPGTPHANGFYKEMEAFILSNFSSYGVVRPEWAKRWGTTAEGPWKDDHVVSNVIPAAFPEWEWTRDTFDRHDPKRLFTNGLLDRIMPKR